jgi:hypothetical protein
MAGAPLMVLQDDGVKGPGSAGWASTSLAPAIRSFSQGFLDPLLAASQAALAAAAREQQAQRQVEEQERQQQGQAWGAADLTW